jgi:hypothetical protein
MITIEYVENQIRELGIKEHESQDEDEIVEISDRIRELEYVLSELEMKENES